MSVFDSHYAGQYDQFYAEKNYSSECNLVEEAVKLFGQHVPDSVLDIGCGTGGHAIELARRGYHVTGVDLSPSMLDVAKNKAASLDSAQRPVWLCGNARDFDAGMSFDLGIMMFAVIGYLTTNDDVLRCLRNVRRQLKPGALFVCDFWYGPSVLSVRPTDRIRVLPTTGGQLIRAATTKLDISSHTADVNFRLWEIEGSMVKSETSETHKLRYFFPQEFELMLSCSGFSLARISAFPFLDRPLDDQTWNALVVARAV